MCPRAHASPLGFGGGPSEDTDTCLSPLSLMRRTLGRDDGSYGSLWRVLCCRIARSRGGRTRADTTVILGQTNIQDPVMGVFRLFPGGSGSNPHAGRRDPRAAVPARSAAAPQGAGPRGRVPRDGSHHYRPGYPSLWTTSSASDGYCRRAFRPGPGCSRLSSHPIPYLYVP